MKISNINSNIFDNNFYYPGESGSKFRRGSTYYDFAGWKTLTGQDTNSGTSDPQFVNAAGGNFSLQSGSPAIDAGANVGLTSDYAEIPFRKAPLPTSGRLKPAALLIPRTI